MSILIRGVRACVRGVLSWTPSEFQRRYGAEFLQVHDARMRTAREQGGVRVFGLALREVAGALSTLVKLWWPNRRPSATGHSVHQNRRRLPLLETTAQDVRFGFRMIRRNRLFAATAVMVVTLGVGAFTAVFSAVNSYFFRPLPFQDPDRLVALYETNPEFGWDDADAAPANVLDWREQVPGFEDVAFYSGFSDQATYFQDGEPQLLTTAAVSGNFFAVLGVAPALGPGLVFDDTWAAPLPKVLLADEFWRTRLAADPGVVGRTLELDGFEVQVAGVMPPNFRYPFDDTDVWQTMGWNPESRQEVWFRRAHFIRPVARLADGVGVSQATSQLQTVVERLQRDYPDTNRVMGAGLMPLRDFMIRGVRRSLQILFGAVSLLVLLACINLANLNLVRASGRAREMAVRMAVGAGRGRVVRQMVTESLVLCLMGGALGLWLGWLAVRAVERLSPLGIEGATQIALDARVMVVGLGVAIAVGVIFGAVPALNAGWGAPSGALREDGRGASQGRRRVRTTGALVGAEVALTLMLVVGAGLVFRSFVHLRNVDPGFRTEGVLSVQISVPSARYPDRDQVLSFWDRLGEMLEGRPEIVAAGTVGRLPLDGTSWSSQFVAETWPAGRVGLEILHRRADRGYFEALEIPLVAGRHFDASDEPDGPLVVVVNEQFAREHFPGENPLGQRIAYDRVPDEESRWYEIVGIVGDQHQVSPGQPARAEAFENRNQDWGRTAEVVMRTEGDPLSSVATFRDVLAELDPLIPMPRARPLRTVWRESTAQEEFILTLLGGFGILALLLASLGIYGVTAEAARRRTREIGIRMALGADRIGILRLMLRQGLLVVVLGMVVGLGASTVATRFLAGQLHGVQPHDPATLIGVVVLLGAVALLASLIPAHRSTKVDPVESLRAD